MRVDTLLNRSVLDPLLKGTSPLQESAWLKVLSGSPIQGGDLEKIKRVDLLGVNYYTRSVLKHEAKFPLVSAAQTYPSGNEYSAMWEIYPEGLYEILVRIWKDYLSPHSASSPNRGGTKGDGQKPELLVTENGVPVPDGLDFDGRVRDERRIRYLQDHIAQVHRAIQDGVPVRGYFHWSLMDNFEWALGYGPRFGLVYVDYKTLKRTVKDSGRWFANVIRQNGLKF